MTRISISMAPSTCPRASRTSTRPAQLLDRAPRRGGPSGSSPVLHHLGLPAIARGACRQAEPVHGLAIDPETRDRGHLRLHRGHDGRHDDGHEPGRQGRHLLARSTRTTGPTRSCAGPSPSTCRSTPPRSTLTADELEAAFRDTGPRRSSCATRPTPAARSLRREELELIADLAEKYDAYVITDEVYEHIVYAPHEHVYFATLPACESAPSPAAPCPRPTPSPAGAWATPLPRQRSPSASKGPRLPHRGCRRAPAGGRRRRPHASPQSYYDELHGLYTHKRDLFCRACDDLGLTHTSRRAPTTSCWTSLSWAMRATSTSARTCAERWAWAPCPARSFFREPVNHSGAFPLCQARRDAQRGTGEPQVAA